MQEAFDTTLWLAGVEGVVVDADHEGGVGAGGGRRHDHERRAGVEVHRRLLLAGEDAGGLDHHVDAEVGPRQRLRVALGEDLDLVAVDLDAAVGDAHLGVPGAEDRVVLEQVGHQLLGAEVVGGHEVDVGAPLLGGPEEVAADAPEPVDADADAHVAGVLLFQGWMRGPGHPSRSGRPDPVRARPAGSLLDVAVDARPAARPRARSRSATASAITTDRCRPPVQPNAMVR